MGCFLQISRPPRRNRTCHPRCPVSTDTLKKQPTLEQLRKWSHSATFRLTAEMPLLGCRSHVGQSKSTKPVRCAHVFQQSRLGRREGSLPTSVLQPRCWGRAPGSYWQSRKPTLHLRDGETEALRLVHSGAVSCRQS